MGRIEHQRGFAHVLLIGVTVVLVGAVGYIGWQMFTKKQAEVVNDVLTAEARQECEKKNDKDLCKFMTSWKASAKYSMTSTDPSGGKSLYEIDGNKIHMKASGGEHNYEAITIDKTTYTKAGDVWYKQTLKDTKDDIATSGKPAFKEPAEDSSKPEEDKTVYKALGKETCGTLTCFKYQIVDPENADSQEFIWFDDKDYKLRKSVSETADGKSETVFAYDNVTINVPTPVKELAPNQYIMPGTTEPVTMPTAEDMMTQ